MRESARPGGTYQTLNEQREGLSLAEERFERARQKMTRLLGSVAFRVTYLVPLPPERQVLAAVFAFVIVYGSGMSPVTTTVRFGAVSIVAGAPSMVQLVGLA
jgi:hypothetical protein